MSIQKVLLIVINHHYYRESRCNRFIIQADRATEQFFKKNRMNIRYIHNSWNLYSDVTTDSLWIPPDFKEDVISLKLTLLSDDDNFYKSVFDHQAKNGINCLCNKDGEENLQVVPCTDSDCECWKTHAAISGKMQWRLCLDFKKSTFLTAVKSITISFDVKEVYWKYYLFNWLDQDVAIIDSNSEIQFFPDKQEVFPGEKGAVTFISDKKIPLSENDRHQFRLIVKKGGIEKNLIKRLPVATATGIQYKDSTKTDLMSSIFIST